jgi:hypothetical protein
MEAAVLETLTGGVGRGFTVLCTIQDVALLSSLAAIAGPTGLLIAGGPAPVADRRWSSVRCVPAQAIPVRSHVVDAAVIAGSDDLAVVAEEVRRVLVPFGDVRVLLTGAGVIEAALLGASIRPLRTESSVTIARGP